MVVVVALPLGDAAARLGALSAGYVSAGLPPSGLADPEADQAERLARAGLGDDALRRRSKRGGSYRTVSMGSGEIALGAIGRAEPSVTVRDINATIE